MRVYSALLLLGCGIRNISLAAAVSHYRNTTSHFNIDIPIDMHEKSPMGYPHELAKFGTHFDYWSASGKLVERIVYDHENPTLCYYRAHPNDTSSSILSEVPPFMVLVDRGNCSFVTKVRHAQHMGASAVLIANNACLCGEAGCNNATDEGKCQSELPIVADDGSGGDITIPSLILQKSLSGAIKEKLAKDKGEGVAVGALSWHRPKFEDKQKMDFFHEVSDSTAMSFLSNFSVVVKAMKDQLTFKPHYSLLDGSKFGCLSKVHKPEDPCYNLCTHNGRYCASPYTRHGVEVTGREVVTETLRRLCLWEDGSDANRQMYWDYLDHFVSHCQDPDHFTKEECYNEALTHSKADEKSIEQCMSDSGGIDEDTPNPKLEDNLVTSAEYGAQSSPAVFLNGLPMKYVLSPRTVIEGLCSAFDNGMGPHICYVCATCGDPVLCASRSPMECHADDGKDRENPNKKGSSGSDDGTDGKKKKRHVFRWLFFIALFAGAGGYVYYKKFVETDGEGGAYSLTEAFMSDDTA